MFAIAFDLTVADTESSHPKGVSQAYADIGSVLASFGFERVQGSLYITNHEDMANLFSALLALKSYLGFHPQSGTFVPSASSNGPISLR